MTRSPGPNLERDLNQDPHRNERWIRIQMKIRRLSQILYVHKYNLQNRQDVVMYGPVQVHHVRPLYAPRQRGGHRHGGHWGHQLRHPPTNQLQPYSGFSTRR